MDSVTTLAILDREQKAFEECLDALLERHEGEFVVFRNCEAAGFFPTYQEAFRGAIDRFGVREVFLVTEVRRRKPDAALIASREPVRRVQR